MKMPKKNDKTEMKLVSGNGLKDTETGCMQCICLNNPRLCKKMGDICIKDNSHWIMVKKKETTC
jgi:hypothetical protein